MKKRFLIPLMILIVVTLPAILHPEIYSPKELRKLHQTHSIHLSRGEVELERRGDSSAPVILFLNGFSIPYSMWEPQVKYFTSHGFQTVRFNYYGRGLSDYPAGDYDREQFLSSTLELIDSLKISKVILVGHSYGAALASEIAAVRPNMVNSIVFVDPMLDKIKGVSGATMARLPAIGKWLTQLAVSGGVEKRAKKLLAEAGVPEDNPYLEDLKLQKQTKGYHRAMCAMFRSNALESYELSFKHLDSLHISTLILYGEPEKITSENDMPTILNAIPSAQSVHYKNSCHLVHLQEPDSVNLEIAKFLNR